jgi:hypothetical protein
MERTYKHDLMSGSLRQVGVPTTFLVFGNEIWFDAAGDEAASYEVLYLRNPRRMVAATDVPDIPQHYHDAVRLWLTHNLMRTDQDFDGAYAAKRELEDLMEMTRMQGDAAAEYEQSGITVYGYSKSWPEFLSLQEKAFAWPTNYVLNLSSGSRHYKDAGMLAEVTGTVSFGKDTKGKQRLVITDMDSQSHEFLIPKDKHVMVHDGQVVNKGEIIVDGPAEPHDILRLQGVEALARHEAGAVYVDVFLDVAVVGPAEQRPRLVDERRLAVVLQ